MPGSLIELAIKIRGTLQ